MKKTISCSLFALSALGLLVELCQTLWGFEAGTGLPRFGNLFLLPVLGLLVVWALLTRRLPGDDSPIFPVDFAMEKTGLLVPVAGAFLVALSGFLWLYYGLLPTGMSALTGSGTMVAVVATGGVSFRVMTLLGVLNLIIAAGLFPIVVSCLNREGRKPLPQGLLVLPAVVLVVRLVLIYRVYSVDPVVAHYAVEVLALVCLTLSLYRLSGLACGSGTTRRFALYSGWAVILSVATLADGHAIADLLFFLGSALTVFGLLRPRLDA